MVWLLALVAWQACLALAVGTTADPLAKVLTLLDTLTADVTADGEKADKDYRDYFEWCDDTAKQLQFQIKTLFSQKGELEAKAAEATSDIEVSTTEIGELATAISESSTRVGEATKVRDREAADFEAGEKELVFVVDSLGRAISVLEREMEKNPASFAQLGVTDKLSGVLQGLSLIADAAGFSASDQLRLAALVQAQDGDDADGGDLGAPSAASYTSHSGSLVEVLEDMKDKAETQLSGLRKDESKSRHEYEMLKQHLNDGNGADNENLSDEKSSMARSKEVLATCEKDLVVTVKDLKATKESLDKHRKGCMQVAADHEASISGRTEELKVVAQAKQMLEESTGGAGEQADYSFVQLDSHFSMSTSAPMASVVEKLARQYHSKALLQLASRIASVTRSSKAGGGAPFDKVKGLIQDMIAKLEGQASSEAKEKAFCDEEMAETEKRKNALQDDVAKLTTMNDQAASGSAALKEEVTGIQADVRALVKAMAEMEKIRLAAHADYVKSKADLENGLHGVRRALDMLRDYYGSQESQDESLLQDGAEQPKPPETFSKSDGAGTGIIGLLEVIESDLAKHLTGVETEESDAQADFDRNMQESKILYAEKRQDVKYKTAEYKALDKLISEHTSDLGMVSAQLSDVLEYEKELLSRCVAKPETYEERKARRDAEIEGLKQALEALEGEAAFLQHRRALHARRGLRGNAVA